MRCKDARLGVSTGTGTGSQRLPNVHALSQLRHHAARTPQRGGGLKNDQSELAGQARRRRE
eukprot:1103759-Alexandrium_andersonii.AAC.1